MPDNKVDILAQFNDLVLSKDKLRSEKQRLFNLELSIEDQIKETFNSGLVSHFNLPTDGTYRTTYICDMVIFLYYENEAPLVEILGIRKKNPYKGIEYYKITNSGWGYVDIRVGLKCPLLTDKLPEIPIDDFIEFSKSWATENNIKLELVFSDVLSTNANKRYLDLNETTNFVIHKNKLKGLTVLYDESVIEEGIFPKHNYIVFKDADGVRSAVWKDKDSYVYRPEDSAVETDHKWEKFLKWRDNCST